MKEDIYKNIQILPREQRDGKPMKKIVIDSNKHHSLVSKRDAYRTVVDGIEGLMQKFADIIEKTKGIREIVDTPPVIEVNIPETQNVHVENPTEVPPVVFPIVQKVEVLNQPEPTKLVVPEKTKAEITNPDAIGKFFAKYLDFSEVTKVVKSEFAKLKMPSIPTGKGDNPKYSDPENYVPVRLTDGKRFYSALKDAYVSAGKASTPFVDVNGKGTQVQLDSLGRLPTVAGGATVTTTSGSPLYVFPVNFPTTQSVFVTNPSPATVTTTSGNPLYVFGVNFPTRQHVWVDSPSSSLSGAVEIQEVVPTDVTQNNPATIYAYDGNGNIATMTKTIGANKYTQQLTWSGSQIASMSAWVLV